MITAPGKWKVAAYLTAIFAAGMVSGWVVASREAQTKPQTPPPPPREAAGPRGKPSIYQVDLDPTQKIEIDGIMKKYGKKWDDRRQQQAADMRQDSSNRNYEISQVLRPEQRDQWEKLRKERDANSRTNSWRGNSNSNRNMPSDKGDHGGPRRQKRPEATGGDNGRGVTNNAGAQSTTPATPPAPER